MEFYQAEELLKIHPVACKRFARIGRHFDFAAGLASLALGLFLSYHISFTQGLFSAQVQWIPH